MNIECVDDEDLKQTGQSFESISLCSDKNSGLDRKEEEYLLSQNTTQNFEDNFFDDKHSFYPTTNE